MAKTKTTDAADEELPGAAEAATDVAAADPAINPAAETEGVDMPKPAPPAKRSPPPGFDAPRQDQIELRLTRDIALGNGDRKKGFRLGWLRSSIGSRLDEALAIIAHPKAQCHCREGTGCLAIVTGDECTLDDREIPKGAHVANLWLADGVEPCEALCALRNFGQLLS